MWCCVATAANESGTESEPLSRFETGVLGTRTCALHVVGGGAHASPSAATEWRIPS